VRKKILVIFGWVILLLNPAKLFAEEKIGLVPAHPNIANKESFTRFQYELKPGEKRRDELAVVNLSAEEQEVKFQVVGADASWVKIASEAGVLVKVAERKWVPFEVEVPHEVKPGEHYIHITGSLGGDLEIRVTVTGELRREIDVEKFGVEVVGGKPVVELEVTNIGNTQLSSLGIRLVFKNSIRLGTLKEKEIFLAYDKKIEPGERVVSKWKTEEKLPMVGKFTPSYSIAFADKQVIGEKQAFVYINWIRLSGWVGALILLGVVLILLIWKTARGFVNQKKVVSEPLGARRGNLTGQIDELTRAELLLEIRRIVREEIALSRRERPGRHRGGLYTLK